MNFEWEMISFKCDCGLCIHSEMREGQLKAWLQALALGFALLFQWSWNVQVWIVTFLPTSGSARQEIPGGLNATCTWGNV